ncbi:MAG: glycosyltransferase family 4 protein [Candidatus Omnitrophica bacterium]|nr:glycosyltransferase family 4 protein [Candidatus Omnitrophota bacterium]
MKVLILGYELPPIGGGTGQALLRLVEEWKRFPETEIEVWTARPPKGFSRDLPEGVIVREFRCLKKRIHFWRGIEQFILLWRCWRETLGDSPPPDVVLVWGGWPLGLLLLGRIGRFPSVVALRGSDVPGFNARTSGGIWRMLAGKVWERASAVTANSPALAALAMRTAPDLQIEIIPNGVNFHPPLPSEEETPERENWPTDRPIRILSVNRLIRRKRVEMLIQAVAQLPREWRVRVEVRIIGEGPEEHRLRVAVRELALQNQVEFLGEVPSSEMSNHYQGSDFFVLASSAEGLSNALLEAMAFGLPCFHATPTGFEEIDDVTVQFRSAQSLSKKLLHHLEHSRRAFLRGQACREVAQKQTWRRAAERYDALLRRTEERC